MSIQDRLSYLLRQALQHTATEAELQELSMLIKEDHTFHLTRQVEKELLQELGDDATADYDIAYWDKIAGEILMADRPEGILAGLEKEAGTNKITHLRRWIPAAAAMVILSVGLYWFLHNSAHKPAEIAHAPLAFKDVAPGGNKAILTLADGTELPLDSAANGALTIQGTTKVVQAAGGQLMYTQQHAATGTSTAFQYNTLRTPRGGLFQVVLPDGTKVWLNAASSLKYPVAFNGAFRKVELAGEAYFEVAHNPEKPFKVIVRTGNYNDSMEVAVLGTQFNIMAYADETLIKTTLLEGAVKVSSNGNNKQLAPGQGADLDKQHHLLSFQPHADIEEAVAWKNGLIQLEGNDIASIMRMIARWYDVEVVFTAPVPTHLRGIIPRNVPISQVLKMMEMTGEVHFEMKGKQIIVSP